MKNENGFTFVELMIAISLLSLVFLLVYSMYFTEMKVFHDQSTEIEMASDSNRAMLKIQEVINSYSDIDVVTLRNVISDSTEIIDMVDDGNNNGLELNLVDGILYDKDMQVVCKNVYDIIFVKGPDNTRNIAVANDTVLIKITMKDDKVTYFLDGGVHLEK